MSVSYPAAMAYVVLAAQPVGGSFLDGRNARELSESLQMVASGALGFGEPILNLQSGAFAGAKGYGKPRGVSETSPSLIIGNFALVESGPAGQIRSVATVHLLVESDTCFLRSSQVKWLDESRIPPSLKSLAGSKLSRPQESLSLSLSPVRVMVRGGGREHRKGSRPDVDRARLIHESYAASISDTLLFPVRSEILAPACAHFGKREHFSRRLAHRDLLHDYRFEPLEVKVAAATLQAPPLIPERAPDCRLQTAPFGQLREDAQEKTDLPLTTNPQERAEENDSSPENSVTAWSPDFCLNGILGKEDTLLSPQMGTEFKVTGRQGRHVTLSQGRSAGLTVGARLVTSTGARLHVIRIVQGDNGADQALAFIRYEGKERLVSEGDAVTFDPRIFP